MKKIWQWLSGKKTTLAGLYWLAYLRLVPIAFDGDVPASVEKWLMIIGELMLYAGLGHKMAKWGKR